MAFLKQKNNGRKHVRTEKDFRGTKNLALQEQVDIKNYNMVIEYHGEQHYKKTGHFEQRAGGLEDL
jgi:hypothetical protein